MLIASSYLTDVLWSVSFISSSSSSSDNAADSIPSNITPHNLSWLSATRLSVKIRVKICGLFYTYFIGHNNS